MDLNQQTPQTESSEAQEKKKAFYAEYIELCKKHGLQISVTPQYMRRDENGLSFYVSILDIGIIELK